MDGLFFEIDVLQKLTNGFGTHLGVKFVAPLFHHVQVLFISEQLTPFQCGHSHIENDVGFEIENPFDVTQGHIQHQADSGR